MPDIRKRNGSTEPFDAEKIKTALAATCDEMGQTLNESTLNSITAELTRYVTGKNCFSSREIYLLILGILSDRGFVELMEAYREYPGNAWH